MIEVRHVARVQLPPDPNVKAAILNMYSYTNRYTMETFNNYIYKDGVCYLPPNMEKLKIVASLLGEEISDNRSEGEPLDSPFLRSEGNPDFKLRDYQVEPAKALLDHTLKNGYSVLSAGTGDGKTVVISHTYGQLGGKVLILVDMGNLINSWVDACKTVWGKQVQKLNAKDERFSDVCITSLQLLYRNPELLRRIRQVFRTTVLDECHIAAADSYKKVLSSLDNKYRLACSASFIKKGFSSEVLEDYLAPISVVMKNENALIPEVNWVKTGVKWPVDDPAYYSSSILPYLATSALRNNMAIDLILSLAAAGRVIAVICITKTQCELIHEIITSRGISSTVYTGTTTLKRDKQVKDDVESGKIQVLLTVMKITKGVDIVNIDAMALLKPTNSEVAAIQVIGRCRRILEGKPVPQVYDFVDDGYLSEVFARNRLKFYKKLGYTLVDS